MSLTEILRNTSSPWLVGEGPAGDVALSTRVRLARNLADVAFPPRMDGEAAGRVTAAVEAALADLTGEVGPVDFYRLGEVPPLERRALVEKHLISVQLARQADWAGVVLRPDESVSVMVNEEDHLRIQCLCPGLQVEKAWELAERVDDALERRLSFAYSPRLGYLATCPTNTGTGLRASVMMHLPGLVMSGKAGSLFNALSRVGVAVRGLYGEGSDGAGNIFQISNQVTLGSAEREVLGNLRGVGEQVVDRERAARKRMHRERKDELEDRVWRAYGILTTARSIASREALAHLSDLRLGADLGVLPQVEPRVFNELLVRTSPAFLQVAEGRELSPAGRDALRAALIRQVIKESEARRGG